MKEKSYYVLDTTVLLHDPFAIYKFEEHEVVIPIVVVEEIDKFKRDQSEVGRNARAISRFLDQERQKKGSLSGEGVSLDGGGRLRIVMDSKETKIQLPFSSASKNNDNWILGVAAHYANGAGNGRPCVLVTKDVNLRIKADALNIKAEDYFNDKVKLDDLYKGHMDYPLSQDHMRQLEEHGELPLPADSELPANLFLRIVDEAEEDTTGGQELLAKVAPEQDRIIGLEPTNGAWGIMPLNNEQRYALDLLLDPEVKLVSLVGKAGTGKTLVALAAGLQQVVDQSRYNRLVVSRPVAPLGKDIGFLPGDVDEKIRPWMQPIFDNLEFILHCQTEEKANKQITYQYFIDNGWMLIEPLTYMRGRSIPNQYFLVDEAQNLTPHEIKSIITRAGHGTKIVLTGDPHQIDHPFLDASTNGLNYLVQRFKGQSLYGHVTLVQGERSTLAEKASDLL